jgi:hypothetical protein
VRDNKENVETKKGRDGRIRNKIKERAVTKEEKKNGRKEETNEQINKHRRAISSFHCKPRERPCSFIEVGEGVHCAGSDVA